MAKELDGFPTAHLACSLVGIMLVACGDLQLSSVSLPAIVAGRSPLFDLLLAAILDAIVSSHLSLVRT